MRSVLLALFLASNAAARITGVKHVAAPDIDKGFAKANAAVDRGLIQLDQMAAEYFGAENVSPNPVHGTRPPESISPRYGHFGDVFTEPAAGHPSLSEVSDNFETVVGNSLSQFSDAAAAAGDAKLAGRLRGLKLLSIDKGSIREDPRQSGMYKAKAVFHDSAKRRDVEAEITGDFSDYNWRLASINLIENAAKAPPPPKPAPARPVDQDKRFRDAVNAYVDAGTRADKSWLLYDPVVGRSWDVDPHPLRAGAASPLPDGFYQGTLLFVDKTQQHSFEVDFLVHDEGPISIVAGTWIRALDDKARTPPAPRKPVIPHLVPASETPATKEPADLLLPESVGH